MARLQTAVLCNAASVEQSGLVSMLGAFIDTVISEAPPPIRQQIWLVARLLFESADVGVDQEVEVLVEALEGQARAPLVRVTGLIRAEDPGSLDPRMSGGGPIVFPLPIEFPDVGLYDVKFSLNNVLSWAAPLLVKLRG